MIIDDKLLDKVTREAMESPRLRMNFNLHENLDDKVQRLVNVLLPSTVIPIHRHRHTAETYLLLRGKMFVVFYDEMGAQIPIGQWHSVEVIEPSAIFEVKEGTYAPLQPEDMMD